MTASSSRWARRSSSTTGPTNLFVAGFIGSPAMNLLKGRIDGGRASSPTAALQLPLGDGARGLRRQAG